MVDIMDTIEARGQLMLNLIPLPLLRLILRLRPLLMLGTHTMEILDTTDTIWVDITHTPGLIGVKQYQLKSTSLPFYPPFELYNQPLHTSFWKLPRKKIQFKLFTKELQNATKAWIFSKLLKKVIEKQNKEMQQQ